MTERSDETAWHDHGEAPGPGRDGWRFTRIEKDALSALVKATGPVAVMDVTSTDTAQKLHDAAHAAGADAAERARTAGGDASDALAVFHDAAHRYLASQPMPAGRWLDTA